MKTVVLIIVVILLLSPNAQANENWRGLKGPYLGQKPPGSKPEVFAPGIISTEKGEMNFILSPDGSRFVYLYYDKSQIPRINITYMYEQTAKGWIRARVEPLNKKYFDWEYGFAPDGRTLYFASFRPAVINGIKSDKVNIWKMKYTDPGWSNPEVLGSPVNTSESNDQYPAFTTDGTIYFFSNRKGGFGAADIYLSRLVNGKYKKVENLGHTINTENSEFDLFIAPDEIYLIFCSDRPGAFKGIDMYISFRDKNDKWSEPKNLGNAINSVGGVCPSVTPDGKYLFFTGEGNEAGSDIYWISTKIIDNLKPKELK